MDLMQALGRPDRGTQWRMAGAFVAGGLASLGPMIAIITFVEGGRTDPSGVDGDLFGTAPMALLGIAGTVLLRRRPVAAAFAVGWALLQAAFTATVSESEGLVVALLPLFWATLLLDLPAPFRLAIALPTVLVFTLAAGAVASHSATMASWSGVLAVFLGAVYFVGWAARERERWASHLAWGVSAAWAALAFVLALADLFEYADGVAIAGASFTLGLLCGVGFGWVATQARLSRRAAAPA